MSLSYEKSGVRYDQLDAFKRACQKAARNTRGMPATARIGFARALFEAGGFETILGNSAAIRQMYNPLLETIRGLLDRGVYIAPALYEAGFVSSAHSDADIAATVQAASEIFATL